MTSTFFMRQNYDNEFPLCVHYRHEEARARWGEGRRGRGRGRGTAQRPKREKKCQSIIVLAILRLCLHRPCVRERKIFFPRAVLITSHRDHQPNANIVVTKTRKKGKWKKKLFRNNFVFGFLFSLRVRRCSRSFHSTFPKKGRIRSVLCAVYARQIRHWNRHVNKLIITLAEAAIITYY